MRSLSVSYLSSLLLFSMRKMENERGEKRKEEEEEEEIM